MSDPKPDTSTSTNVQKGQQAHKGNRRQGQRGIQKTKFQGAITEMKGNIYDCSPDTPAHQFIRTTEALADYFVNKNPNSGIFRMAIMNGRLPVIPPVELPEGLDINDPLNDFQRILVSEAVKERNAKVRSVEQLNMTLYSNIWSQCTPAMRERIEGINDYDAIRDTSDGIALLNAIKAASYNYVETTYKVDSVGDALINLVNYKQHPGQTPQEYHVKFKALVEVYEQLGGHRYGCLAALEVIADEAGVDVVNLTHEQKIAARELELASLFIRNADPNRYSFMQAEIKNSFADGINQNPLSLHRAYTKLSRWTNPLNKSSTVG